MTSFSSKNSTYDIAIIGGGAAGLMASYFAAKTGKKIVLLEGSKQCGLKILVSGGGRCNVLPQINDPSDFYTEGSPNILKRLFRTWRLEDVHRFFEETLKIPLVDEPETGKVFPRSQSAKSIRDALAEACMSRGIEIQTQSRVQAIQKLSSNSFSIERENQPNIHAEKIILATGGRSLPKTGSDGLGYTLAESLGHSLLKTYPALVPLTTSLDEFKELSGISLPVRWRALKNGKVVEERVRELLFTHRGFSGPAILDCSHWWVREGAQIEISFGNENEETWEERFSAYKRQRLFTTISQYLPRRLSSVLMDQAGVSKDLKGAHLDKVSKKKLLTQLTQFPLPISGDEGFKVAEVTGGGIPLSEVSPSTLESRKTPGLYLCGEILDVIGRIGGFNFLWAWVTGRLAGESAEGSLNP